MPRKPSLDQRIAKAALSILCTGAIDHEEGRRIAWLRERIYDEISRQAMREFHEGKQRRLARAKPRGASLAAARPCSRRETIVFADLLRDADRRVWQLSERTRPLDDTCAPSLLEEYERRVRQENA